MSFQRFLRLAGATCFFFTCIIMFGNLSKIAFLFYIFVQKNSAETFPYQVRHKRVVPRYSGIHYLAHTRPFVQFRSFYHKWPWIVRLHNYKQLGKRCAGALISKNLVVTAAHCAAGFRPEQLIAKVADYHIVHEDPFEAEFGVRDIIVYPFYHVSNDSSGHEYDVNDIALLTLDGMVECSEQRNTALFPWRILSVRDIRSFVFPNPVISEKFSNCYVAGWGKTAFGGEYPDRMYETGLSLISKEECSQSKFYGEKIRTGMICAGDVEGGWKTDSCTGDSGAPLVCKARHRIYVKSGLKRRLDRIVIHWHLVGLVSWGYQCARHQKPGVYTDVGAYQNWIMRELKRRPQLEADFWNSLIQCRKGHVVLKQCQHEGGRKLLEEKGVFCDRI